MFFFILLLGANLLFSLVSAFAEEGYTLEPIVIKPSKSSLASAIALRNISIITQEEIKQLPVRSLPQVLTHILGVDIRQRGALGVQADLSIRGANFEQVLVCINGLRQNDPQTGHHNMDLPLSLADIERIEILPGHGLSLYGPAAFGGTINIVTRIPRKKEIEIESSGGNFGLSTQGLSINYPLGEFNNRLSFARKKSSGYRPDTDFEISTLSFHSRRDFSLGRIEYLFGYTDKDFGADSFYSNLYPYEEEHTDTRFFNLKAHIKSKILELQSDFYYRRHTDKFILDRNRPWWYTNYHTSYSYGTDLEVRKDFAFGSMLVGGEICRDKITSTRLGNHLRDNQALYVQFQSPLKQAFVYNLGLRLDHFQRWDWQVLPSVSLGYKISPAIRLKSSFGRSFRVPSFTDLYYVSPANIGNEDLTPEKAWSYEAGLSFHPGSFSAELNYYRRWAEDLIGWVRSSPDEAWQAENIAEVDAQGIGLELSLRPAGLACLISRVDTGYFYQYLASESIDLNTKYTLDFLKHHAHLGFELLLPGNFTQSLSLSYKQRVERSPYFLLDSRISKRIEKDEWWLEMFLDITNLLNTSYSEQTGVAMPGRWIIAGVRIGL